MLTVGGLFDGIGLLAYGLHLAGLQHRWLCEVQPFRRAVLGRRFPGIPVHRDVRSVGARSAERVDVIAGGFPCKGASSAGKRNGFEHPETRLWREMRRVIAELQPRFVVIENVAALLSLQGGECWQEVLDDLAALGFDVQWDCFPAAAFGAPHLRDRLIAVATHTDRARADVDPAAGGSWPPARERDPLASPHPDERALESGWGGREAGGADQAAAADTAERHEGAVVEAREGSAGRARPAGGGPAVADPGIAGREELDGAAESSRPEVARTAVGDDALAADADGGRQSELAAVDARERPGAPERELGGHAVERGVAVAWGDYGAAIRRWEQVVGPAPEPLLRRVDDGRTGWVERSRLSALGDGVLVQLGWMVGSWLMDQA